MHVRVTRIETNEHTEFEHELISFRELNTQYMTHFCLKVDILVSVNQEVILHEHRACTSNASSSANNRAILGEGGSDRLSD